MFDGQEAEVRKQTRKLMRAILKFPLLGRPGSLNKKFLLSIHCYWSKFLFSCMDKGALGDDIGDVAGRLRLPMPSTYNGSPSGWGEWSWNFEVFEAYISTFETSAI